jgi:hypothetical protein
VENRAITFEYRDADWKVERLPVLAIFLCDIAATAMFWLFGLKQSSI